MNESACCGVAGAPPLCRAQERLQSITSIRFGYTGGYDTKGNSDMAKEELLETEGIVAEVLPDTRFRVTPDKGVVVSAYGPGKIRKHRIRILAGDKVTLEMPPTTSQKRASTAGTTTSGLRPAAPPSSAISAALIWSSLPIGSGPRVQTTTDGCHW